MRTIRTAHCPKIGAVGASGPSADGPWAPLPYSFDMASPDGLPMAVLGGFAA